MSFRNKEYDFQKINYRLYKGGTMEHLSSMRKNPSREVCEKTIKRILITEVLQNGSNTHFRTAADFMNYFESLYPSSDALTKQVQRAVKALDMPKDEKGYFIVNKTNEQFHQEKEISNLLKQAHSVIHSMEQVETIFISADPHLRSHLIHLLETSLTFSGSFITISETSNGILIYTEKKAKLLEQLHIIMNYSS